MSGAPTFPVLIVDDDPDICWALAHLLEAFHLRCISALDGQGAMQIVHSQALSAVLIDAKLPDIDGLELARQIRTSDAGIAIVLISGYFYQDDAIIQASLQEKLISGFIEKPFSHEKILSTMDSVLKTAVRHAAPGRFSKRR